MRDPLEDSRDRPAGARSPTWCSAVAAAVVLAVAQPNLFGTIAVIFSFFVMIMLHEFGHFVMAKRAGMKVTEFFVGFGPRVWSFRKGETEYGLKAFPLGGYCRIIGMTNLEEVDPEDEPARTGRRRFLPKLDVALAGSTMHFLIALVLIFIVLVGAGDWFSDPHVSTVVDSVTGPAAKAMIHPGDTRRRRSRASRCTTWDDAVDADPGPSGPDRCRSSSTRARPTTRDDQRPPRRPPPRRHTRGSVTPASCRRVDT